MVRLLGLFFQTPEATMPRSSDPSRRLLWQARLKRFSKSQLTIAQFCHQEGVSVSSFYLWRNKLAVPPQGSDSSPRFLPVRLSAPPPAGPAIKLPGGAVIELPPALQPEQLTQWITACIQATAREDSSEVGQ